MASNNIVIKIRLLTALLLMISAGSYAQSFARFQHDTLSLGNAKVKFWYTVQNGQVCLSGYQGYQKKLVWFASPQPDLVFVKPQPKGKDFIFNVHTGNQLPGEPECLEAELNYKVGELNIRRVWRIYPNVPAIGSQYFFKGKASGWFANKLTATGTEIIENAASLNGGASAAPQAAVMPLDLPHWQAKVVRFTDATDGNNNLVEEQVMLPYARPIYREGNVLLLSNHNNETGIFILKQAPLQESQQRYPGFDFAIDQKQIRVTGLGLSADDIIEDDWRASYNIVIGVTNADERSQLLALRQYQKKMRQLRVDRDEMVMSNTWGDRSQDSRMNEAFVLKELEACARLGIDHFQLDDGWQQGLSRNSSVKAGKKWNDWKPEDWQPNATRFPSHFKNIVDRARALHIELGLWFNPSATGHYAQWERDAKVLAGLYEQYGIRIFKIDGLDLADKQSEENVRKLFDYVVAHTGGKVVFNLDVTAGRRGGYFFFSEYGNVFLENRYTDWGNYYPHYTLRNLWQLSKYVPAERIQAEWLNNWRNVAKYSKSDLLAPGNIPWEYELATTLMAQPLAWMEVSNLPEKAFAANKMLQNYKKVQHDIHSGTILPIGAMPDGASWTGFQSIHNEYGYLLVFREHNQAATAWVKTWLNASQRVRLTPILGSGRARDAVADADGRLQFSLPSKFSFVLYRYRLLTKKSIR